MKDEIIYKKIDIEIDKLKMYVFVLVATIVGDYTLLINLESNIINKWLLILGSVIILFLLIAIIYSSVRINKFFKQLNIN